MFDSHSAIDAVTRIVFFSSLAHTFLPPWEMLDEFPTAKKYYKVLIYIVGYMSVAGRSSVYKSLGTANGTQISHVSQFHGDK